MVLTSAVFPLKLVKFAEAACRASGSAELQKETLQPASDESDLVFFISDHLHTF